VTPLFDAHPHRRPGDRLRPLPRLVGCEPSHRTPAVWNGQPERDLRIFGWEPPGEEGVSLIVTDPTSIWGAAGLHTGDRLVTVNDSAVTTWPAFRSLLVALRMGDTVRLEVQRPTGDFRATVVIAGFERPVVRIEEAAGATERQRALRARWLAATP
jgi:hypothetical protein